MSSYLPNDVNYLIKQLQLIPHPEGGFFRETYRSGSVPMTSRGLTDTTTASYDNSRSLVHVGTAVTATASRDTTKTGRPKQISDSNEETGNIASAVPNSNADFVVRNALTSIYWVPTIKSPKLILGTNLSDHVHYYQGGGYAFAYYIYSPQTGSLRTEILGPNLVKGHKLQVCVRNGEWKCGHLVSLESELDANQNDMASLTILPSATSNDAAAPKYVIIGEGVGPGFDIHDFEWITERDIDHTSLSLPLKSFLKQHLHRDTTVVTIKEQDFDQHYDRNETSLQPTNERT